MQRFYNFGISKLHVIDSLDIFSLGPRCSQSINRKWVLKITIDINRRIGFVFLSLSLMAIHDNYNVYFNLAGLSGPGNN